MTGTRRMHLSLIFSQLAVCEQVKPPSFLQSWEQPSPSLVLPSSHSSLIKRPSPHSEVQPEPEHFGSVWQVAEQPSPAVLLPSSHCSDEPTILSPQITSSWQGLPGGLHEKPGCVAKQLPWQPSPS